MTRHTSAAASWLPALGLLALLCTGAATQAAQPKPGAAVALVFPPWWTDRQAAEAAAAQGRIIRVGAWSKVIVVQPDKRQPPGGDGTLLRLDPIWLGCF